MKMDKATDHTQLELPRLSKTGDEYHFTGKKLNYAIKGLVGYDLDKSRKNSPYNNYKISTRVLLAILTLQFLVDFLHCLNKIQILDIRWESGYCR